MCFELGKPYKKKREREEKQEVDEPVRRLDRFFLSSRPGYTVSRGF